MNCKRRGFLIKSSLLSLSSLLPAKASIRLGLDSSETNFLVVFKTFFPSPLSEDQYQNEKGKFSSATSIDSIYTDFSQSKKILKSQRYHSPLRSDWVVIFSSKADYYSWCYEVVGNGHIDELRLLDEGFSVETYGALIPKEHTNLDLSKLFQVTITNWAEPLHQTKTVKDLSPFQLNRIS